MCFINLTPNSNIYTIKAKLANHLDNLFLSVMQTLPVAKPSSKLHLSESGMRLKPSEAGKVAKKVSSKSKHPKFKPIRIIHICTIVSFQC